MRDAFGDGAAPTCVNADIGRVVELALLRPPTSSRSRTTATNCCSSISTTGRARTIDKSAASHISDLAFSPDGRWLAYACAAGPDAVTTPNPDTSIIRIAKVKSGAVHDVTPLLRVDRSPGLGPGG